jgi:hypothetical protein
MHKKILRTVWNVLAVTCSHKLNILESYFFLGILNSASESLFAYNLPGDSFENFRDIEFEPVFAPVFDDPVLRETAETLCGDNEFCLFDIAATKMVDIGMATMTDIREFDTIVELAQPSECGHYSHTVIYSPYNLYMCTCVSSACDNYFCVATNTALVMNDILTPCVLFLLTVVCVPACENGVCVATNTCACSIGFSGDTCTERSETLVHTCSS